MPEVLDDDKSAPSPWLHRLGIWISYISLGMFALSFVSSVAGSTIDAGIRSYPNSDSAMLDEMAASAMAICLLCTGICVLTSLLAFILRLAGSRAAVWPSIVALSALSLLILFSVVMG